MYAVPIFGALFVFVTVVFVAVNRFFLNNGWLASIKYGLSVGAAFTFVTFLLLALAATNSFYSEERAVRCSNQELLALVNKEGWNAKGSAHVFLFGGSASISGGSSAVYRYAIKTELGKEIKEVKLQPSDRIVIDDNLADGQKAQLDIYEVEIDERYVHEFFRNILPDFRGWKSKDPREMIYQFHIPRGSLEETIVVGL